MILTVCTLLQLLQLIKRCKMHVLKTRKLTLFSYGHIDLTTRISATVPFQYVFPINVTGFLEVYLQHVLRLCNRRTGTKYVNTETTRRERGFMVKQCL